MAFTGFPGEAFAFYEGLRADNSKTYWSAHSDVYESCVRAPLRALVDALRPVYGEAKIFRPMRDLRFSADKSPYKDHQDAFFPVLGGIGYTVEVCAEGLFTAAGFVAHFREQTTRYRAAVDAENTGAPLAAIMATLDREGFARKGHTVRTPRGVPPTTPA